MIAWLKANWLWVLLGLAALAAAYGAGRFTAPTKIEERVKIEYQVKEVEKVVEKVVTVAGPVRIRTVTKEVPIPGSCDAGGVFQTVKETEVVEERGPITTTTDTNRERDLYELGVQATERVVTRDAPRLTVAATGGMAFNGGAFNVGAMVLGRIVGPFVFGAQAEIPLSGNIAAGSARLVLGLTF